MNDIIKYGRKSNLTLDHATERMPLWHGIFNSFPCLHAFNGNLRGGEDPLPLKERCDTYVARKAIVIDEHGLKSEKFVVFHYKKSKE